MSPSSPRSIARRLAAAATIPLVMVGCVSMHASTRPHADPSSGAVSLTVYADDDAKDGGYAGPPGVASVLEIETTDGWEPVFRALRPTWTVTGLDPGRYRLTLPERIDATGDTTSIEDSRTSFDVERGQLTEIEAVLDHVSKPLVAAGVVAGVVAAVALHEWLQDHGLPEPPLPPPPPAWLVDLSAAIVFDLTTDTPYEHVGPTPTRPRPLVTGLVPAPGAMVDPSDARITIALAADPGSHSLAPEAIEVVGARSGPIEGHVRWDPIRWWIIWEPSTRLPAGDSFSVLIHEDVLRDATGRGLPEPLSSTFRTR